MRKRADFVRISHAGWLEALRAENDSRTEQQETRLGKKSGRKPVHQKTHHGTLYRAL